MMYSGPLPPSNEFAGYDKSLPGAAERILSLAEREAEHRHAKENNALKLSRRGQLIAFIITVLSLITVVMSIFFSQPVASIAPSIIAITGLASIFVSKNK
jgi:uncharacterized membrane protein